MKAKALISQVPFTNNDLGLKRKRRYLSEGEV